MSGRASCETFAKPIAKEDAKTTGPAGSPVQVWDPSEKAMTEAVQLQEGSSGRRAGHLRARGCQPQEACRTRLNLC